MAVNFTNSSLPIPDVNTSDTKIYFNNNGTRAFVINLIICATLGLLFILLASCLRSRMLKIYSPRVLLLDALFPLGKLPNSLFAWLIPGWMARDDDIFNYAGFDALVYVRFLKLCLKCAIGVLPYSMLVLLPLNLYGGGPAHQDVFTRASMSNIVQDSHKLWAHFFAVWIYSLLLYYLIYHEWKIYILYKQADLARGHPHQYTVLVKDLPENLQSHENLRNYVDQLFKEEVQCIIVAEDRTKLRSLILDHDELVWKLERAQFVLENTAERPEHRVKLCGAYVDSISSYEKQLNELQSVIESELEAEHASTPCALLMFGSLRGASIAAQTLWDMTPLQVHGEPAPEPQDIIWENLKICIWKRWLLFIVSNFLLFLLVVYWLVPVGLFAVILSMENLTKTFPWLTPVLDSPPFVKGLLEGFLPCIGLYIFFAILPLILFTLSRKEGLISHSSVDVSVICKMFIFKVFNQFLILALSGSILRSLYNIIQNPLELPLLLGRSLPSMSSFFINYTLIGAFLLQPLELSRLIPMIIIGIKLKWLCKTEREKAAAWRPPPPHYHMLYAENLFIFIIGLAYSIIAPLITPFFAFYFGMAYLVWVHQVLCIYIPNYKLGGSIWPYVCSRMLVAMAVFQVLMIGIFGLKENFVIMALTAPLPFLTLSFYLFIQYYFSAVSRYLALTTADNPPEINEEEIQKAIEEYKQTCIPSVYELSHEMKVLDQSDDQTNDSVDTEEPAQIELNAQNEGEPGEGEPGEGDYYKVV